MSAKALRWVSVHSMAHYEAHFGSGQQTGPAKGTQQMKLVDEAGELGPAHRAGKFLKAVTPNLAQCCTGASAAASLSANRPPFRDVVVSLRVACGGLTEHET